MKILLLLLTVGSLYAGGIEGRVVRTDGSKVNGTARVSTSWNSKSVVPRDGYYRLDLGDYANGSKVTVYINGYKVREVRIPSNGGNATVNMTLKGSGDVPVR